MTETFHAGPNLGRLSDVWIIHGDCIEAMRELADDSIDAIVTDPPYGLGFMGKEWDALPPGLPWAQECLRVLKPGGHLLAFGGTRTWHRLAVAVEDAGFEIRDSIAWLYGSGFSKGGLLKNKLGIAWCSCGENPVPYNHASNTDLSRVREDFQPSAIARREGESGVLLAPVQRGGEGPGLGEARPQGSSSMVARSGSVSSGEDDRRAEPSMAGRLIHRAGEGVSDDPQAGASEGPSERVRSGASSSHGADDRTAGDAARGSSPHQQGSSGQPTGEPEALPRSHEPLDDGARRGRVGCPRCGGLNPAFGGYSVTLKPAFEPVVVGRKPFKGNVAQNVLTHGTGALNIDGCRIAATDKAKFPAGVVSDTEAVYGNGEGRYANRPRGVDSDPSGRWPANVCLDSSQAAALDEQSGYQKDAVTVRRNRANGTEQAVNGIYGSRLRGTEPDQTYGSGGGASRFFLNVDPDPDELEDLDVEARFLYCAKAPKKERPVVIDENGKAHSHATVKPLTLMRWLVRLVTPPGGTCLDPFAGSGTTVEAALLEDFRVIGIERETDYLPLIQQRIARTL